MPQTDIETSFIQRIFSHNEEQSSELLHSFDILIRSLADRSKPHQLRPSDRCIQGLE